MSMMEWAKREVEIASKRETCVGIMVLLVRFIVRCSLLLCLICHLIKRM